MEEYQVNIKNKDLEQVQENDNDLIINKIKKTKKILAMALKFRN